jgi:hypothetical protein
MAASILRWICLRAASPAHRADLGCLFVAEFIDQAFLTPTLHAARCRFACGRVLDRSMRPELER